MAEADAIAAERAEFGRAILRARLAQFQGRLAGQFDTVKRQPQVERAHATSSG